MGVDTLSASQHLRRRTDLNFLEQVPKGVATYYVPGPRMRSVHTQEVNVLSPEHEGLSQESEGLSGKSGLRRPAPSNKPLNVTGFRFAPPSTLATR